jgi:hypothetical protein
MKGKHHHGDTAAQHHKGHMDHHDLSHHHRAHRKHGGHVGNVAHEGDVAHDEAPHDVYAGANSPTVKEAMKKKRGGKVHHGHKEVEMHGHKAHHRLDRPARKHGGKVGAEMNPFSAARHVKTPAGRDVDSVED